MSADWKHETQELRKQSAPQKVKITGEGRIKCCLRTQSAYNQGAFEGDEELEILVREEDFEQQESIYLDAFGEEGVKISLV